MYLYVCFIYENVRVFATPTKSIVVLSVVTLPLLRMSSVGKLRHMDSVGMGSHSRHPGVEDEHLTWIEGSTPLLTI